MLTCGPLPILSPAMKHQKTPIRQGIGSQSTHLWATSHFVPRYIALGTPIRQGLGSQATHLWATSHFVPRYEALVTPHRAWVR